MFEKYIERNGKKILKIVKTDNNYILVDLKTNRIIGNNQKQILNKIQQYLIMSWEEI